jgi:small-conductance mechanosensitive channel
MPWFHIFKFMNASCPYPGKSVLSSLKIPAIILLCIILLFSSQGSALYAQNDSLEITAISLREIASEAASNRQQIRDLLVGKVQVTTGYELTPQIDSLATSVSQLDELTKQILASRADFSFYNSLALRWQREQTHAEPIQASLQKYLADMEDSGTGMLHARAKWALTLETSDPSLLNEDIVSRISGISHYIDSTHLILLDSLSRSLARLNRVEDLKLIIETRLHEISDLQKQELGRSLLTREESIFALKQGSDSIYLHGDRTFLLDMGIQDTKVYLQSEWSTLVLLLFTFIGLLIAFIFLKRSHTSAKPKKDDEEYYREKVLAQPVATAFVFTMLLALWWLPARPVFMKEIFVILFILPFLPIFRDLAFKAIRLSLIYLFAVLLYNMLNDYLQAGAVYLRISSLLESIALFSFHIYFLLAKRRLDWDKVKGHFFYQLLNTVQPFYFLLTLLAVFANIIGYRNYADLVNEAVLLSLILILLFATGFFSLISVIHYFFRTKAADKSRVLLEGKERIYKWLYRNLRIGTAILWIFYTMKLFYLWNPFIAGVQKVLDIGYEFGELSLSIRDILSFVLVIYLSWLASFIIRNLLEVELFGRLKMPRGVPKAISSLTQYFLITLGFLLALSAAGFSMQNLGLLAGALGVGIGFGLQNIVNNFISGLILAFERPVTVGDIIIVAGHEGEVKRIGIRASVIKQYDGSEVIVPNAELISNRVINWTLSKYTRRIIMTIHTHQETDTGQVLKIMEEAANQVEFVLKKPEAKAYFHGIKDKQLEFALYYWASGNILDSKSLVNQQVQKNLKDAGISFVMPLHVVMQKEEAQE